MKRTFKSILSVAAAAMAFTACNVEPIETPVETTGTHKVTFVASQVETKTTMDIQNGIASFDWEEADVNYFHIFENEYSYKAKDTEGTIDDNGLMQITATFENGGTAPFTYFGFFAPTFFNYPQVPAAQTDNGKYDPMADILIAKPVTAEASQSEEILSFQFKRIVAINIMTLKGLTAGETVSEVKIVSDKPIAGKYDYVNEKWYNSTDMQITVSANSVADENGMAVIYFVSAPVENAQLTITATTAEGKTYSKEFAKTITFSEGGVKAFGVTVEAAVPPVEPTYGYVKVTSTPADWSGEYLIADENKVFNGLDAANDFVEGAISNNVLTYADGMAKISIEKMDGGYSLKILNGDKANNYISGKSGNNTIVYGETAVANEITIEDGLVTILSNSTSFRFNATSGQDRFRYYKTATTGASYHVPSLYRYQEIVPVDEVHVTSVSIDETLSLEVGDTYTLVANVLPENATNKSVTWESNGEDVVTVENGVVTAVGVGETTITVKTVDGEFTDECVVTVTSSSVSIANTPETAYTASEAKALIEAGKDLDTEVYVKGIVSKIVTAYDSNYGNISFNVSADGATTGDQFQFFRNFKGAENEKWTDEDAKPRVGDFVIGYGTLTKYNSTYEFEAGNYIVSIDRAQYLEASASKTSGILAEGETITITVDTNIDSWSASITGDSTFALDQDNKTATSIPVIVSENTDVVNGKTATVTITAGDKEVNIELSQLVKTEGGQGGETNAYTMTIDSSNNGENNVHWTSTATTSLTYDGVTWSTSVTGTSSVTASKTYCQIGSKSNPASKIVLSTKDFANKTVTSVKVTCYCMSNTGPALTVTAGSTTLIDNVALTKTNPTEIAGNGTAVLGSSDELIITFNSSVSAAICISKIEVTYN